MNKSEASDDGRTDEDLMKAFKLGDPEAFNMLYKRYSGRIFAYLRKRMSHVEAAEEVFQDTFLKLSKNRASFDSKLLFAPWLFTICRNSLIDFTRKIQLEIHNRQMVLDESLIVSSPSVENHLETLLQSLTARERKILHLRFQRDLTFQKISQTIGISAVNVRKIASRAIERLRGKKV